jgi:hypothetical protein
MGVRIFCGREILSRGIGPLGPKQNFYPKHAKFLLVALASKRLGAQVHAMMRVSWSTSKMHLYTFFYFTKPK